MQTTTTMDTNTEVPAIPAPSSSSVSLPEIPRVGRVRAPKQFAQLAIPVLDGSGSMTEKTAGNISKADAVNGGIRDMLTRFKGGKAISNFSFAVVTFDDDATIRLQPTEGTAVDDNADYNPLTGHGGGTHIFAALEKAEQLIEQFLSGAPAGGVHHSAVVLLMSDGECAEPDRTREVAARIKQRFGNDRVTIAACLFATIGRRDPAGEALLKELATDPVRFYKTVYDGESLRSFFEASASAASGGIKIG
jgi:uncharacterized protein YegL